MEIIITNQEIYDNRPILPVEVKEKWLTALRSGSYEKGRNYLCKNNKYCCLGVWLDINNAKFSMSEEINGVKIYQNKEGNTKSNSTLPIGEDLNELLQGDSAGSFIGFQVLISNFDMAFTCLTDLNDSMDTFEEVIQIIENHF